MRVEQEEGGGFLSAFEEVQQEQKEALPAVDMQKTTICLFLLFQS